MSITGTYILVGDKLIRTSKEIPKLGAITSDLCSFAKPYWETNIADAPIHITSRKQKADLLRERGLIEKSKVHGGIDECKFSGKIHFDLSR